MTKWIRTLISFGFMLVSPYIGLAILSNSLTMIDPEYLLEACRGISSSGVCTPEEAQAYFPAIRLALYVGLLLITLGLLEYAALKARIPERATETRKMFWEGTTLLWKILRVCLLVTFAWVIYVNYFQ